MKLQLFCLLFISWSMSASALRCWTCENARSPADCLKSGHSKQCRFLEKVCQTEVRYSVGWGQSPIIRTGCKEPHACGNNHIQNPRSAWYPTQCNKGIFNSVCRCCCGMNNCNKRNFLCVPVLEKVTPSTQPEKDVPKPTNQTPPPEVADEVTTSMQKEKDLSKPTNQTALPEPACSNLPDEPANGQVTCDEGTFVGSTCAFTCKVGYERIGSKNTTCIEMAHRITKWDNEPPTCKKEPVCDGLPKEPKDGSMDCHGDGEVGTKCSFFCDDGREIQGTSSVKCEKIGSVAKWSSESPTCLPPTPPCPPLGNLRHGNITCTQQDNGIGTKCHFECSDDGYFLSPNGRVETECVSKDGIAMWTRRKPCCNAQCPPVAKKDIVIVIDSSRSISIQEWRIMKDFVTKVIGAFEVAQDMVQFAVYRFNKRVDTKSQVLFGDYENIEQLKQSVMNLPKRGGGTYIGNALQHARNHVLKHKNREDVSDMVLVLTDGKSKDDFEDIAEDLRGDGVEIIALGISRTGEEEFMEHLTEMTGDRELVIDVNDVHESFSDTLVERVAGKICEVSCEA